ncbi:hypothetical protein N836_06915 [Leptolyngbya sp. Heron Island J]|nr:hypothetical protein N836_06915 [Leptolyngbya sp. Heron Island J]
MVSEQAQLTPARAKNNVLLVLCGVSLPTIKCGWVAGQAYQDLFHSHNFLILFFYLKYGYPTLEAIKLKLF